MNQTYALSPTACLFHADARDALKALPDNSLDSCCTDPPYHLTSIVKRFGQEGSAPAQFGTDGAFARSSRGFMGKTWDGGDIAFQKEFWAEVLRVLKPGAFLAAFGATRGYHRMAVAIEDAGFEIRDSLMWVYGQGFPKSHAVDKGIDALLGARGGGGGAPKLLPNGREHHFNIGFGEGEGYDSEKAGRFGYVPATAEAAEWSSWGTALKPAFEPIVLARKPLSEGTVAANVLKWRTGAINVGACRISLAPGEEPYSYPNGRGGEGWHGRDSLSGNLDVPLQGNKEGRWPANVVTDGSDEVVGMFPAETGKSHGGRSPNPNSTSFGFAEGDAKRMIGKGDSGSAARYFKKCEFGEDDRRFHYSAKASKADRAGSKHPTVKPISLIAWLARLITPPGGTVLDPFAGSGTTGAACAREGFNCVLVEREAEYVADICGRYRI